MQGVFPGDICKYGPVSHIGSVQPLGNEFTERKPAPMGVIKSAAQDRASVDIGYGLQDIGEGAE